MRKAGRPGRTVILRLRFADYSRSSRSWTLPRATASTEPLLAAARRLLEEAQPVIGERGLTLVGVTVSNLDDTSVGVQLELPLFGAASDALDSAVDDLRERFGTASVSRGAGRSLRKGFHG